MSTGSYALLAVARTGVDAVVRAPLRSLVTTACVVAVLLPWLAGLGVSRGVQDEAEASVRFGADLYVTGSQFGRDVPIPLSAVDEVRRLDGVDRVVPRIIGQVILGKDAIPAVLVGIPPGHFPEVTCVEGRLPALARVNELVVGSELARRLRLRVGDLLPPFYRSRHGERLSQVVGIFRSDGGLAQAHLVFAIFDTAAAIFDQEGLATDLLVSCRTGSQDQVRQEILQSVRLSPPNASAQVQPRVTTREDLEVLIPRGLLHREGIFNVLYTLAFAVSILVILVTSGFGLAARRREIGILKATGWQTDEILVRDAVESLMLSLAGASLSVLLAFVWLRGFNGYWIAGIFLVGVDTMPAFRIPFRLTPVPVLLAFLVSFVVVLSGTLFSSWRAATTPPFEAIRSTR
jgi:ABC-type lipoprotein release transport system permease subunit